jgi:hypothetical protein
MLAKSQIRDVITRFHRRTRARITAHNAMPKAESDRTERPPVSPDDSLVIIRLDDGDYYVGYTCEVISPNGPFYKSAQYYVVPRFVVTSWAEAAKAEAEAQQQMQQVTELQHKLVVTLNDSS